MKIINKFAYLMLSVVIVNNNIMAYDDEDNKLGQTQFAIQIANNNVLQQNNGGALCSLATLNQCLSVLNPGNNKVLKNIIKEYSNLSENQEYMVNPRNVLQRVLLNIKNNNPVKKDLFLQGEDISERYYNLVSLSDKMGQDISEIILSISLTAQNDAFEIPDQIRKKISDKYNIDSLLMKELQLQYAIKLIECITQNTRNVSNEIILQKFDEFEQNHSKNLLNLAVNINDMETFNHFKDDIYRENLLFNNENYELSSVALLSVNKEGDTHKGKKGGTHYIAAKKIQDKWFLINSTQDNNNIIGIFNSFKELSQNIIEKYKDTTGRWLPRMLFFTKKGDNNIQYNNYINNYNNINKIKNNSNNKQPVNKKNDIYNKQIINKKNKISNNSNNINKIKYKKLQNIINKGEDNININQGNKANNNIKKSNELLNNINTKNININTKNQNMKVEHEIQYVYDSTSNEQIKNNVNKNKYNTTIYNSDLDYIIEKSKQDTNEFYNINKINFDNIDDNINTNNMELNNINDSNYYSNSSNDSKKSTDKSSNKSSSEKEIDNISKQISDIEQQIKEKGKYYDIIFNKILNERHESLREKAKEHIKELINNANILNDDKKLDEYMKDNKCTYLINDYNFITELYFIKQEIKTLTDKQLSLKEAKNKKQKEICMDYADNSLIILQEIISNNEDLNIDETVNFIKKEIENNRLLDGKTMKTYCEKRLIEINESIKALKQKHKSLKNKSDIINNEVNISNFQCDKKKIEFMYDNFEIICYWWTNRTMAES